MGSVRARNPCTKRPYISRSVPTPYESQRERLECGILTLLGTDICKVRACPRFPYVRRT